MLEVSSASRYFKTNYLASEAPETRRSRDGTQLHRSSDGMCATEPMQLHIRSLMNVKQALGEHLQLYAFKAWWIYQKVNEAERCGVTAPPLFLMFKHILRFFCKTKQTGRKVRSHHQGPTDWMLGLLYEYIWSQGLVPSRAHFTVLGLTETQSFFVILNASQDDFVLLVVNRESFIVIETTKSVKWKISNLVRWIRPRNAAHWNTWRLWLNTKNPVQHSRALFALVSSIKTQTPARDSEFPGDSSSAQISTTVTTVKWWRWSGEKQ